jgi:hypothetical protein
MPKTARTSNGILKVIIPCGKEKERDTKATQMLTLSLFSCFFTGQTVASQNNATKVFLQKLVIWYCLRTNDLENEL